MIVLIIALVIVSFALYAFIKILGRVDKKFILLDERLVSLSELLLSIVEHVKQQNEFII